MYRHPLAMVALATLVASAPATGTELPSFVADQVIVKFRPDLDPVGRESVLGAHGLELRRALRGTGALLVSTRPGDDVLDRIARLRRHVDVVYAEPNYYRPLLATPDDPRFGELYGLDNTGQTGGTPDADIDAPEAWEIATGSEEIVVAVLDSGLDLDHEDIADNLYTNSGEIADNGIDDDGNGFVDDVHGWDFVSNDNDPSPSRSFCVGHGTHTAGTIGAVGDNGIGITGVSHRVRLMPVRAFFPTFLACGARDADLIDAIDYIGRMGVSLSNHSWGSYAYSAAMHDAVARARHLFVAAAGNGFLIPIGIDIDNRPLYPAAFDLDHVIAVAATDDRDRRAIFSNFGVESVDLAAPGVAILSTLPDDDYGLLDGTSMATPHVAGAAALLLAADPEATPAELKHRLLSTTDFVDVEVATGGRLNADAALRLPAAVGTVEVVAEGPTLLSPGESMDYGFVAENTTAEPLTAEISVRVWRPDGRVTTVVGPETVTLPPGATVVRSSSQTTSPASPAGEYRLIGRIEVVDPAAASLDEDVVVYTLE